MINVVLITTGSRPDLLRQSIQSLLNNAYAMADIHLTVVVDGLGVGAFEAITDHLTDCDAVISCPTGVGASAARNIGASSIPKYRRGSHVCFFDDDIYAVKGWDVALLDLSKALPGALCSGHGHPYNHGEPAGDAAAGIPPHTRPLVISTVNFFMPWAMWDQVGWFQEPGGASGSEDFDWCMRASKLGYGFAVTEPHCIIHTGLRSSNGKPIVGFDQMVEQNNRLIELFKLKNVVING